jgi:hypothetical protein
MIMFATLNTGFQFTSLKMIFSWPLYRAKQLLFDACSHDFFLVYCLIFLKLT